jgi:uncharacterized protein YecA (UPF0149 family)
MTEAIRKHDERDEIETNPTVPRPSGSGGADSFQPPDPLHEPQATSREPPPQRARNSPCPCGSGQKYKRCCGQDAPPVLVRRSAA